VADTNPSYGAFGCFLKLAEPFWFGWGARMVSKKFEVESIGLSCHPNVSKL
jgi:hypothetical protein